jgi:hypothetical protein
MKYQLHDYEIDSFILEKDSIILSFPNGFYAEDDDGNEIKPLRHKLVFTVDRTDCPDEPLESFLLIRRINHRMNGWKDISFSQFASLFKKGNMVIHDEYDSKLTNWKMLQLNAHTDRSNIELFITDIIDIACYE